MLLLVSALSVSASGAPAGPRFDWSVMPTFIHASNQSGPLNPDAIALMAKYPMATVEKFQGPCAHSKNPTPACDQESLIIEPLRQIKAINPNCSTVFYVSNRNHDRNRAPSQPCLLPPLESSQTARAHHCSSAQYNSVLDFAQYKLHGMMLADPSLMLHDSAGKVAKMGCPSPTGTCDVFDFAQAKARALFIAECVNATKTGVVDGCFLDRAVDGTPTDSGDDRVPCAGANCRYKLNLTAATSKAYAAGHVQVLTDLQTAIGEGPVIANHAYGPPHDNMVLLEPGGCAASAAVPIAAC